MRSASQTNSRLNMSHHLSRLGGWDWGLKKTLALGGTHRCFHPTASLRSMSTHEERSEEGARKSGRDTEGDNVRVPRSSTLMRQILPGPLESHHKPNLFYVWKKFNYKVSFFPNCQRLRSSTTVWRSLATTSYPQNPYLGWGQGCNWARTAFQHSLGHSENLSSFWLYLQ